MLAIAQEPNHCEMCCRYCLASRFVRASLATRRSSRLPQPSSLASCCRARLYVSPLRSLAIGCAPTMACRRHLLRRRRAYGAHAGPHTDPHVSGRVWRARGGVNGEIQEKWSILAFLASHEVLGETRKRIIEVGVCLVRDQLPILVQLRALYGPVPFVPSRRNVVAANLAVAVEILAEQGRLVTCVVEPRGQRGPLSPEVAERLETPTRRDVAPDQMVVRVLSGQDRGP